MKKNKIKIIAISVTVVVLASAGFFAFESKKNQEYKDLVNKANLEMDAGNFQEAKELYSKSMELKKEGTVENKLEEIKAIESEKSKITEASDFYAKGDYDGALEILNGVNSSSDIVKKDIENLRLNINQSIKEKDEAEANKKLEEEKRIEEEKKSKLEEEKKASEAKEKNDKENSNKENNNVGKTYKFITNISNTQRNEKPSFPYVTYGRALDSIARDYFSKFPNSGEKTFISVYASDGSFFADIYIGRKYVRTYEMNAINGEIIYDLKSNEDREFFDREGEFNSSITIK